MGMGRRDSRLMSSLVVCVVDDVVHAAGVGGGKGERGREGGGEGGR